MPIININTDALVRHTNRLERMHRSALPVAVRNTLSKAAFDVKQKTMPAEAKSTFIERKPTFFKANSKVEPAKGFDLRTMKATVGFVGKDQAVEDLEMQEHGGEIGGRTYIPLKQARTAGNWRKNVRAQNRISDIRGKVVEAKNARGKNDGQRFVKSAVHAGKGGFVIGNRLTAAGNKILFQVRGMKRKDGNMMVKSVPLFAVKRGRKVSPEATHFMRQASETSAGKMEQIYISEANKQLAKIR